MAQLDSNLVSCFLCCRAAIKAMAGNGGRIVNVAARPALEPRSGAGMTAYTIAKSGVAALTMAFGEEVAKQGILVNAVAPSIMDTPANRAAMPKADFDTWPKVETVAATRTAIEALATDPDPHYGISTGFGALATQFIPNEQRAQLQRSLIRSHAAGTGPEVETEVRRMHSGLKIEFIANPVLDGLARMV